MCRNAVFCLIVVLLISLSSLAGEVVSSIAAIVNDEVITTGEVMEYLRLDFLEIEKQLSGEELLETKRKAWLYVINQLIWNKIVIQEARSRVSDEERWKVEQRIEDMKREMITKAGSLRELERKVEEEGHSLEEVIEGAFDASFVESLKNSIREKAQVTPQEMKKFYREHQSQFRQPKEVSIRQILLKFDQFYTKSEARESAEKVLSKVKSNGNFADYAKKFHGPHANDGGLWDFRPRGVLMPEVDAVAFQMQAGKVSGIIESDLGYHIIKVEKIHPARLVPFDEMAPKIEQDIRSERQEEMFRDYLKELQEKAYIKKVPIPESILVGETR